MPTTSPRLVVHSPPKPKPHCSYHDPELWFPVGTGPSAQMDTEFAKSVCAGCPLRLACLDHALDNAIEFGVWGGMDEHQRRVRLRKMDYPKVKGQRNVIAPGSDLVAILAS